MIRVLQMIGSLNIGGSQTLILNIYKKIDRAKVQFDFIVDHPEQLYFSEEVKELGGKIYFLPNFNGHNVFQVKKAWDSFFKEHKEYSILHSHVRSYASIFLPIARKNGLYTIIHSHSTSNGNGFIALSKRALQYSLRFQADYYMACSENAGKWLFGNNIVKKDNFMILPNAVDTKKYVYNSDIRERMRANLGIKDRFVIGHVGRMEPPKNHLFLIDVFSEILQERKDAVLLLVGNGSLRKEIEAKIDAYGIKEKVFLAGNRSNTEDYYQAMDVFVFPSLYEGLGIVGVEAQANGLECFVSENVPQMMDMGIGLVHYLNLDDGSQKWAEEIINSRGRLRQVSRKQSLLSSYDINEVAKKLQEFYMNICTRE